MKKILLASIYTMALIASNSIFALTNAGQGDAVSLDAFSTLQATQHMVYLELHENMQFLDSTSMQQGKDFGIDDINSYSVNEAKTLTIRGIDG
jgi:hypothetical protein